MRLRPGVPVLRRGDGCLQIGLRRPLVLSDLDGDEARFLEGLEGRAVPVSAREQRDFRRVLGILERATHLLASQNAGASALERSSVRWRGADAVVAEAARTVALAGVTTMSAVDERRCGPYDPYASSSRGLTRSDALARAVRETGVDVRWISLETTADLEVVRSHGGPDLVVSRLLLSRDVPHLLVVSDEDGISVGPLVRPGVTACAGCCAMHRTDADSHWPLLALQVGDPRRDAAARYPAECSSLAGTLAAREVVSYLRGDPRDAGTWAVPLRGEPAWERMSPHPACGCGAAGGVGDETAAARARMVAT